MESQSLSDDLGTDALAVANYDILTPTEVKPLLARLIHLGS
jgi:hypothetical protein